MAFGKKPADEKEQVNIATQLYRYQNYKGTCLEGKVSSDIYQMSSIVAFHSLLRKYIATGKKDLQRATDIFYNTIDTLKSQCYTILRPTESERARQYKEHDHSNTVRSKKSITKVVNPSVTKPMETNKINISNETLQAIKHNNSIIYALQINDKLKIFPSKERREGWIEGVVEMMDMDSNNFKRVKLTIEEE